MPPPASRRLCRRSNQPLPGRRVQVSPVTRSTTTILTDDPFNGRHPTSHERMTGLPWDASYHDGPAPCDLGRPQPAIVRLASEGGFRRDTTTTAHRPGWRQSNGLRLRDQ